MPIETLVYLLLLAASMGALGVLLFGRRKQADDAALREELRALSRTLDQNLADARKEASENLHRQFQLVSLCHKCKNFSICRIYICKTASLTPQFCSRILYL
jgi:hypothetical protein